MPEELDDLKEEEEVVPHTDAEPVVNDIQTADEVKEDSKVEEVVPQTDPDPNPEEEIPATNVEVEEEDFKKDETVP